MKTETMRRALPWVAWIVIAAPALAQVGLLSIAIARRFAYPYDLEWMEGGLLAHAQRIGDGEGLYGPPSVDFIPYLYTPLYPGLLAALGKMFGLSYQLGRMISILALCGIAGTTLAVIVGGTKDSPAPVRASGLAGGLFALGLFAASYPFVEGWYDLVRVDTLFLCMVTGGLALLYRTANSGEGVTGHARTAAAAAILGLSFFCKQTGVMFTGMGLLIILIYNWRRALTYVAVSGLIGLGGTAILQSTTDRWFWVYVYKIHQVHDFNWDRYWMTYEKVLWRYPAMTVLVGIALLVVVATVAVRRRLPGEARTFLVWTFVFAGSLQVGAIGFATEFSFFNAWMPPLLHGAMAAGAALPALAACVMILLEGDGEPRRLPALWIGQATAAAAALVLVWTLIDAWWDPHKWVPKASDERAGAALVARIAAVEGEVWVPSHPWYAHLAGKRMYAHQMSIKDVTARKPRPVLGLDEALRDHRFAQIFLDNRDLHNNNFPFAIGRSYVKWDTLLKGERPRTLTGAHVKPESVWVPIGPAPLPTGGLVLYDFEGDWSTWPEGWSASGTAWGNGAVDRKADDEQGQAWRIGGRRWVTSMHGGDAAEGNLNSPLFEILRPRLTMRLGGGDGAGTDELRVELIIEGEVKRAVQPPGPSSERFREVTIDVGDLRGAFARLRFVDDATGAWGHMNVDEIWFEDE